MSVRLADALRGRVELLEQAPWARCGAAPGPHGRWAQLLHQGQLQQRAGQLQRAGQRGSGATAPARPARPRRPPAAGRIPSRTRHTDPADAGSGRSRPVENGANRIHPDAAAADRDCSPTVGNLAPGPRPPRSAPAQATKLKDLLTYSLRSVRAYLLREEFQRFGAPGCSPNRRANSCSRNVLPTPNSPSTSIKRCRSGSNIHW